MYLNLDILQGGAARHNLADYLDTFCYSGVFVPHCIRDKLDICAI